MLKMTVNTAVNCSLMVILVSDPSRMIIKLSWATMIPVSTRPVF